jgi:hypothetical protein
MTNHKMTATDTQGVIGENFWPDLQCRIARAARMPPVEASKMMAKFISDNLHCGPDSKAIATSADLRAMYERALEIRNAPTAEATARWQREYDSRRERDDAVKTLLCDVYWSARVGSAAAEYNLEKAGVIEMIQGHHPGVMLPGDDYWDEFRWTLTDRGRGASDAQLERIILRDPPLEIAEWDAEDEANDLASNCGGCVQFRDRPWLANHST